MQFKQVGLGIGTTQAQHKLNVRKRDTYPDETQTNSTHAPTQTVNSRSSAIQAE